MPQPPKIRRSIAPPDCTEIRAFGRLICYYDPKAHALLVQESARPDARTARIVLRRDGDATDASPELTWSADLA